MAGNGRFIVIVSHFETLPQRRSIIRIATSTEDWKRELPRYHLPFAAFYVPREPAAKRDTTVAGITPAESAEADKSIGNPIDMYGAAYAHAAHADRR